MDRTKFLKLLSASLYPLLREEGFKGSGTTLRRHDGRFHHIVQVQGSTSTRDCYINLGAHVDFLPAEGGGMFSPGDFGEPSCAFRVRLEPEGGEKWNYGNDEAEARSTIAGMIDAWKRQGHAFFAGFRSADERAGLEQLILALEGDDIHPARAFIGARIAAHTGDVPRALRIARSAIDRVGERATGLRAKLDEFIRETAAHD